MLTTKQVITAQCDVCGDEDIKEEEIPEGGMFLIPTMPDDWWRIGPLVICYRHKKVKIKADSKGTILIEDNSIG